MIVVPLLAFPLVSSDRLFKTVEDVFSTLVILYLIPVLYTILDDLSKLFSKRNSRIKIEKEMATN